MINFRIDSAELNRFAIEAKLVQPKLLTALRRRVREIGSEAVDAIKEKLDEPSPDSGNFPGEVRAELAQGTRTTISFSRTQAGVRIATSASHVPAEHKSMVKAYNMPVFRHPVFAGRGGVWVEQKGRPYFNAAILPLQPIMQDRIYFAIDEALRGIGAHS